jgi:hypothetical protein
MRAADLSWQSALVIAVSAFCLALAIWQAISPFTSHVFYGVDFDLDGGRVLYIYPSEIPAGTRVAIGDRVVERASGDALRGFRLEHPLAGDKIHIVTTQGTVILTAQPRRYPTSQAISEAIREISGAIVIALAALLLLRRSGAMALAFWLWAISGLWGGDLSYALDRLPPGVGLTTFIIFGGLSCSGLALISFALRFPSGTVADRWRWTDRGIWTAFYACTLALIVFDYLYYAGRIMPTDDDISVALVTLPLVAAAVILLWKRTHAAAPDRAKIAWASTAFLLAAAARAVAFGFAIAAAYLPGELIAYRLATTISNVLPLLAIYPILRYRLFDLGFVVSRATLYSVLTLAAFGTLAAANWIVQHFVTDRLAFVLQPVVSISIGLAYFRARGWVQHLIERVLFREHLAAEEQLESAIRALPFVERAESINDVLVADTSRTLRLASAALFSLTLDRFERVASSGWDAESRSDLAVDDALVRDVASDGSFVSMSSDHRQLAGFLSPPREPAVAFGIVRRGELTAIVLYGRHENGTELEPEELRLIRRLADASAIAYETAEVTSLRAKNAALERQLLQLRGQILKTPM